MQCEDLRGLAGHPLKCELKVEQEWEELKEGGQVARGEGEGQVEGGAQGHREGRVVKELEFLRGAVRVKLRVVVIQDLGELAEEPGGAAMQR